MRVIDARNPDEEFVVARALCAECGLNIHEICTPLHDENGKEYPPVYTWKHLNGAVLCETPRMARPKESTVQVLRAGIERLTKEVGDGTT